MHFSIQNPKVDFFFYIFYGCLNNLEKLRKTRNKSGFTKNSIFNWKSFIFQSYRCYFLRFLILKKCKKNLGFRLSPFERYMAEKLSFFIELPVWRVTGTWSGSLYCVFEISILYHWLLAFVRKWSQIAVCNQKLFLLHARRWWAFASCVQPLFDCSDVLMESFNIFIINYSHIFWEEVQVRMHHVDFQWPVHFNFLEVLQNVVDQVLVVSIFCAS